MKVQTLDESVVREIGHAFGYYDDGKEPGFVSAFSSRDGAAEQICGYVRMTLKAEMLYTTSERGEGIHRLPPSGGPVPPGGRLPPAGERVPLAFPERNGADGQIHGPLARV